MKRTPYKLRVRRVRAEVLVDLLIPVGRSGYTAVESINLGVASLKDALASLDQADYAKAPRLKEVLFPTIT